MCSQCDFWFRQMAECPAQVEARQQCIVCGPVVFKKEADPFPKPAPIQATRWDNIIFWIGLTVTLCVWRLIPAVTNP